MPAKVIKLPSGGYQVRTPNAVHARNTSLKKAKAQQRLLNAIEYNPEIAEIMRSKRKSKVKSKVARPRE